MPPHTGAPLFWMKTGWTPVSISTTSADTERHHLTKESIVTFVPGQADRVGTGPDNFINWDDSQKTCMYLIVADTSPLCFLPGCEGELFKVGISANPAVRLKALQTGSPFKLSFRCEQMAWGPEPRLIADLERLVHQKLSHLATVGEWFFGDPQIAVAATEAAVEEIETELHEMGI